MLNFKQDSTIINFLLFTTYVNLPCWGSQNFIAELTSVGKKGSFDSNSAFCSSPSIAASSTKLISFQSFFIYEVIYFIYLNSGKSVISKNLKFSIRFHTLLRLFNDMFCDLVHFQLFHNYMHEGAISRDWTGIN